MCLTFFIFTSINKNYDFNSILFKENWKPRNVNHLKTNILLVFSKSNCDLENTNENKNYIWAYNYMILFVSFFKI